LISPNFVLTSSKCVTGRSLTSFAVAVGENDYNVTGDGEQELTSKFIFTGAPAKIS
jgi:hypothetical protein